MGFTDFITDAGLSLANEYLKTRSYIVGSVLPRQIFNFYPSLPCCVVFRSTTLHIMMRTFGPC